MSPAIWDAMKRFHSAAAAAPSAALLRGPSLYALQQWGDAHGYDTFLLGSAGTRPVLIGLTGKLWREEYEVCRDKNQKWSPNGRDWKNFSAWNPTWSAVCWYDVALILRQPKQPALRRALLQQAALPEAFCRRLRDGWYAFMTRGLQARARRVHAVEHLVEASLADSSVLVRQVPGMDR